MPTVEPRLTKLRSTEMVVKSIQKAKLTLKRPCKIETMC